jgi:polyketide biosynthesis enoyl-CoA hydratase PksH
MGVMQAGQDYRAIRVRIDGSVCTITLALPETGNPISRVLIEEIGRALDAHAARATVVVLEGAPEVFCIGADFKGMERDLQAGAVLSDHVPEPTYALWQRLATGPFISLAYVRGKVNAGGVGLVAACDVVLGDESAVFSLSEMMFGLTPACVMPFLARRIGLAKANYMTLSTQPVPAAQALAWGLLDACDSDGARLLRKHLLRLTRLSKASIVRHKQYSNALETSVDSAKALALQTNIAAFSDPVNLDNIGRYVATGRFPWEAGA